MGHKGYTLMSGGGFIAGGLGWGETWELQPLPPSFPMYTKSQCGKRAPTRCGPLVTDFAAPRTVRREFLLSILSPVCAVLLQLKKRTETVQQSPDTCLISVAHEHLENRNASHFQDGILAEVSTGRGQVGGKLGPRKRGCKAQASIWHRAIVFLSGGTV